MTLDVLVVDDNNKICELIAEFLTGENYEVLCTNTGAEALELLAARSIDVAVIDLLLSDGVSGERVIGRATAAGIPVITMSGALASDPRGRDLKHPHLRKPFQMAQLRAAIDSILR